MLRCFITAHGKLTKKEVASLADILEAAVLGFKEWEGPVVVNALVVERRPGRGRDIALERTATERRRAPIDGA